MTWVWQKKEWPNFTYRKSALSELENQFLQFSGMIRGTLKHLDVEKYRRLTVDLMSQEALKTAEIEGEILNRASLQSSILRNFGLQTDNKNIPPPEQGMAEMMVDLHKNFDKTLTHKTVCGWHKMLTKGRADLKVRGKYRTHKESMQIVSGPVHKPKIHFEAPPSRQIKNEMQTFIVWFNDTAPRGRTPLPPLTRAGLVHLYFVCIHPFEDGNGRIGRALAEKALSQCLGQPTLIALSSTIQKNKKAYYDYLQQQNRQLEATQWLEYFGQTILDAQEYSQRLVDFIVHKAKYYDRLRGQFNRRQEKVISKMFREGLEGFKGGLSADNYLRIVKTSRATATRDLQDLVEKGALRRTGEKKYTRYHLNLSA